MMKPLKAIDTTVLREFNAKLHYDVTKSQVQFFDVESRYNAENSLFTCFYSPRYTTIKEPVTVTICKHGATNWELELTIPEVHAVYNNADIRQMQKQSKYTSTITTYKLTTPRDGESGLDGDSCRQRSSDSTSSNSSQRSRLSGRRPLGNRHHPYANNQGNGDDEDDDEDRKPSKQKITTQCEANTDTNDESKPSKKKNRASLPSKLDTLDSISPINRPNTSLMSETSFYKLWGYAKNWVAGSSDTKYTDDLTQTPSRTEQSKYIPLVSPVNEDPPAIVINTPIKEVQDQNADKFTTPSTKHQEPQADAYYTGLGNPEITPVSRVATRSMKPNFKSYLHTIPLSPQQKVQERLRTRSHSTSLTGRNPGSRDRTRRVSEGDVQSQIDNTSYKPKGYLKYKRRHIETAGTHECDGNTFHVHKILEQDYGICKASLETEIKAALQEISPPLTPGKPKLSSTEIFWRPSSIKKFKPDDRQLQLSDCTDVKSIESLKYLLAVINYELTCVTNQPVNYNGLRIVSSCDRTTRLPLKGQIKSTGAFPFALLHIGKQRNLSITPLRFNPAMETTEVCEVCIDNYSFLTLPSVSTENLHIYFAPENCDTGSQSDQQILIIPFVEHLSDPKVEFTETPTGSDEVDMLAAAKKNKDNTAGTDSDSEPVVQVNVKEGGADADEEDKQVEPAGELIKTGIQGEDQPEAKTENSNREDKRETEYEGIETKLMLDLPNNKRNTVTPAKADGDDEVSADPSEKEENQAKTGKDELMLKTAKSSKEATNQTDNKYDKKQ
ncbi:hypothetical protein ACHWQZ_G010763 [Mnemiopsis leidyi]